MPKHTGSICSCLGSLGSIHDNTINLRQPLFPARIKWTLVEEVFGVATSTLAGRVRTNVRAPDLGSFESVGESGSSTLNALKVPLPFMLQVCGIGLWVERAKGAVGSAAMASKGGIEVDMCRDANYVFAVTPISTPIAITT